MLNTRTSKIVNTTTKLSKCVQSYTVDGYVVAEEGTLCSKEPFVLLRKRSKNVLIVINCDGKVVDLKILKGRNSQKDLTRQYWNYRIDAILKQYRDSGFFVGVLSRSFEKQVYLCKKANATVYVTLERNIEGSEYKIKEVAKMC